MRVIDLLNKIANDEENDLQTEFEFQHKIWNFYKLCHSEYCLDGWLLNQEIVITKSKNDEVEILDNEKKEKSLTKKDVEALGYACGEIKKCFENGWNKSLNNKPFKEDKKIERLGYSYMKKIGDDEYISKSFKPSERKMVDKINEIIDYLMENKKM